MEFEFRRNEQLPALAWCAAIARGREVVVVEHGGGVETGGDYFVEGAWNGDFQRGGLHTSTVLFGSGGRIEGSRVYLCPTSHSMDRLYHTRREDRFLISNSLPFLLEASNDWIDYADWRYENLFISFARGLDRAASTIPTRDGSVQLHYCSILALDRSLNARSIPRPGPPGFDSYEDYVGATRRWISQLIDNAADAGRRRPYTPLTTISSGYDSAAAAALASEVGCKDAVNVTSTRPLHGVSRDDSGRTVADGLGLIVHSYSREDLGALQGFPEAEFLASGNGGDDLVFSLFEEELRWKVLFTGFKGDTLWSIASQPPERSLQFEYIGTPGSTINEFRLRVGFVHLPVPLLSFTSHADIDRISGSEEMRPWRLGNDYDRPIPRRILEDKGVPREAFGVHKGAVSVPLCAVPDAAKFMSADSARSLRDYAKTISGTVGPNLPSRLRFWRDSALARVRRHCSNDTFWRILKTVRVLSGDWRGRNSPWIRCSSPENSLKFHWGLDHVRERYTSNSLGDL